MRAGRVFSELTEREPVSRRTDMVQIVEGHREELIGTVRNLFLEYAASLGFDLCFQGFERELAELPGGYAPPGGRILLAQVDGEYAGCVAFRQISPPDEKTCEMKRLYVKPNARNVGLGRTLVDRLIAEAKTAGYRRMYLDTLDSMTAAIALYLSFGFKECPPYSYHPIAGTRCFDLDLALAI